MYYYRDNDSGAVLEIEDKVKTVMWRSANY